MTGVILLNMGGPDSLEAVRPFLYNLFSDRGIIKLGPSLLQKPLARLIAAARAKHTQEIYAMIGGKSPLTSITRAQAAALEAELNSDHARKSSAAYRVYAGMRYWHPFIRDSVRKLADEGAEKIIALSLYPHYSAATTGSAMREFRKAATGLNIGYHCIESWFDHPLYIDALAEKIEQGMRGFEKKPVVLFSAHSLPQKLADDGDPYPEQIMRTIKALRKKLGIEWRLSFQSKSGPVRWLGPSTEEMLKTLAADRIKELLVVPVSFVSDHIETLYEIDIIYKNMAAELGITLKRTESLNTSPLFIKALADLMIKA
jgi:ferrochelatase